MQKQATLRSRFKLQLSKFVLVAAIALMAVTSLMVSASPVQAGGKPQPTPTSTPISDPDSVAPSNVSWNG